MTADFKSIEFADDRLVLIDQTKLPLHEEYIKSDSYKRIAEAIEKLEVRGAPAIGIAAAYALALAFKNKTDDIENTFHTAYNRLRITRPTAVNLFWALDRLKSTFENRKNNEDVYSLLIKEADKIFREDENMCDSIAENGLVIFNKKSVVLTHCNTGSLVSAGGGTALYVIQKGFENGLVDHVFADETRPLLQGSRLTAFELDKMGVPFSIITDSSAAYVIKKEKVDLIIVGADRIARNGDAANKIGTYNLAVLAAYHGIPFYIAAPTSTVDTNCTSGEDIKIEFRNSSEISMINGTQITKESYPAYSPAFDVTPNNLISGIITEQKLNIPPYNF